MGSEMCIRDSSHPHRRENDCSNPPMTPPSQAGAKLGGTLALQLRAPVLGWPQHAPRRPSPSRVRVSRKTSPLPDRVETPKGDDCLWLTPPQGAALSPPRSGPLWGSPSLPWSYPGSLDREPRATASRFQTSRLPLPPKVRCQTPPPLGRPTREPPSPAPRAWTRVAVDTDPVSYTHLTLPTICSV